MPAPRPAAAPPADDADLRAFVGPNAVRLDRRRLLGAAWAGCWPAAFLSAKPLSMRERATLAGDTAPLAVMIEEPAATDEPAATGAERPAARGFGVSLAGAEFGVESADFSAANPGTPGGTYLHPTPGAVGDLAAAGVRLVRFPVRWERLQPVPGGALHPGELALLRLALDRLAAAGRDVILDLHNYARFVLPGPHEVLIDQVVVGGNGRREVPVSRHHLAEFWATLAAALAGRAEIVGWGLMNEPHDLAPAGAEFEAGPACDWREISRLAAAAIRAVDPATDVYVAGADWSGSERWVAANGTDPWVDDPHVVYEAHCYFDADGSGKYHAPFADERGRDPQIFARGARRVAPFLDWCANTGARGFVGEFGVPNAPAGSGWLRVLRPFLRELELAGTPGCLWAAGEWWGDYPLNHHPAGGVAGPVLDAVLRADARAAGRT